VFIKDCLHPVDWLYEAGHPWRTHVAVKGGKCYYFSLYRQGTEDTYDRVARETGYYLIETVAGGSKDIVIHGPHKRLADAQAAGQAYLLERFGKAATSEKVTIVREWVRWGWMHKDILANALAEMANERLIDPAMTDEEVYHD
jgi:hypothetical protein